MSGARTLAAALAACLLLAGPALAQKPAARKDSPFGNIGGSGKDPIKIDADRLDVFDRENKAIFAGNVVAVQGESTIRCSTMTVFYKRGKDTSGKDTLGKGDGKVAEATDATPARNPAENGIQKVDCAGPVTVVQKDQDAKRIVLTGNVVLSQCQNVTRGQRLVYDMNTGRANMDPVAGGRVSALFVPGEKAEKDGKSKGCTQPPPKPKAQVD